MEVGEFPSSDTSGTDVVRVGLLGYGNVGVAFTRLIDSQAAAIALRTGLELRVTRIAVRDLGKPRPGSSGRDAGGRLCYDAAAVVADPSVDVIVELVGGIEPARSLVLSALAAGKPVVTANKELLSTFGAELLAAAEKGGVDLFYEASVAGAIPLVRLLNDSLAGERIVRVMGIVNGTTNYMLTSMSEEGSEYSTALAEAQALGYAEADPDRIELSAQFLPMMMVIEAMITIPINASIRAYSTAAIPDSSLKNFLCFPMVISILVLHSCCQLAWCIAALVSILGLRLANFLKRPSISGGFVDAPLFWILIWVRGGKR